MSPSPRSFSKLLSVERSPFSISRLDFDAPNVDKAAKNLGLVKEAKKHGQAEIPDSQDTNPSGFELKIHQWVEKQIAETKAQAEVALMGLDEQIHRLDVEDLSKSILRAPKDVRTQIRQLTHQVELDLDRSRTELEAVRAEYERFRDDRGINREPNYPHDKSALLWIAFGIAVMEALLNAWFFASGSRQGLVGGIIIAMLFAFGDILVSFNLGRFVRKIAAPQIPYRLLGLSASLVFAFWAFGYNLVAGHLRESLQSLEWSLAVREAWTRFLANPTGLQDIESWILVGIGLVLTLSVMASGVRYDETWFNFERLHRRLRGCEDEYNYHRVQANENALAIKEAMVNKVLASIGKMQDCVATREVCIERKEVLARNYTTFIITSQEACRTLTQLYRDENRKARSTPAPASFRELHACDLGHKATEDQVEHRDQLAKQKELLQEAKDSRLDILEQLDESYEAALQDFVQSVQRAVEVRAKEARV